MATYKVPQDVEADDKLIGPFGFRQFVYLMITGGLVLVAVGLWQIFPLLAIIPVPFAVFLLIMALPLKKDQPMETYLAALFQFYFKPRNRWWAPGQRETTILITAPKKEEEAVHAVNPEEASNRLSFLANVIDSEGEVVTNNLDTAFLADAANTQDIFDIDNHSGNLSSMLAKEDLERRQNIAQIMSSGETQPAAVAPAPVAPTPSVAPANTYSIPQTEINPLADGVLTSAEILTGGHAITSGDIATQPVTSVVPVVPVIPVAPVSNPVAPTSTPAPLPVTPAPAPITTPTQTTPTQTTPTQTTPVVTPEVTTVPEETSMPTTEPATEPESTAIAAPEPEETLSKPLKSDTIKESEGQSDKSDGEVYISLH